MQEAIVSPLEAVARRECSQSRIAGTSRLLDVDLQPHASGLLCRRARCVAAGSWQRCATSSASLQSFCCCGGGYQEVVLRPESSAQHKVHHEEEEERGQRIPLQVRNSCRTPSLFHVNQIADGSTKTRKLYQIDGSINTRSFKNSKRSRVISGMLLQTRVVISFGMLIILGGAENIPSITSSAPVLLG